MPDFANPFPGKVPDRNLTLQELIRSLRQDVAAEEEATSQYMAQADVAGNPLAKKVLIDIADEERVHVGEFQHLIQLLTGDEDKWLADGAAEVDVMAAAANAPEPAKKPGGEPPGIGSLKQE